jgi:hypothetical protein
MIALLLAGCASRDVTPPAPTTPPSPTTPAGATVAIVEQYFDAAASCWRTRGVIRPAADWPDPCDSTVDTGAPWAYDLLSDENGNCARLPKGCEQTDVFFGPCEEVTDCCDPAKLSAPSCE